MNSNDMKTQETVEEFVLRSIEESKFDVDIDFCLENKIKFKNDEIDASFLNLFETKSNKAAFKLVSKIS